MAQKINLKEQLETACEILNDEDNQTALIWDKAGKKCMPLHCIEYEIDDEDEDRIYYDVKHDCWGTYANIELSRYTENLEKEIIRILEENGIKCKINKRGHIRVL